jgi:signal transduction histidine kinase
LDPGAYNDGQLDAVPAGRVPRQGVLATMAEELLQVQDIDAALRVTIRGVERALPGYEVMITERVDAGSGAAALPGGECPDSALSCSVVGARGTFGLLYVIPDHSRHLSRSGRLFLQAAAAVLGAAIVRLQSEAQLHVLYRALRQDGVQRVMRVLGNCLVQEMNQPITAARNYLYSCRHLIEDGAVTGLTEIARLQDKALAELGRIGNIVGDIRNNMEDMSLDLQDANINEIIEAALILLQPDIVDMKIRVYRILQPELPLIRLDKGLMLQLFFNFFSFSIDAMHQAVKREITVKSGYTHSDQIEVLIADTGHGMDGEFLDNPCMSGLLNSVKGKGIDLAICRHAIDAHHGKYSLSITPGGGSTLLLTLPLHA